MNSITYQNSLQNMENYKLFLENSQNDVLDKYISLICEYIRFIIENIKIKKTFHFKFILMRGLETITHVFNNILLYTKNLEMSHYHAQKAFYYYVEFVGQISEEQNAYLQLTSRDASIYVYKKTIFEINNEARKNIASVNNDKLAGVSLNMQIYKNMFTYFFMSESRIEKEIIDVFTDKFEILCNRINSVILSNDESSAIDFFVCYLNSTSQTLDKYLDILNLFSKRLCKTKNILSERKIKKKILDETLESILEESSEKFVHRILS